MSRAPSNGWGDGRTIAALAAGGILLVAFVWIQSVRQSPLVPLGIFRRPGVARGNAAIFLLQGSYVGWQFMSTLYLQNVHGWSPVDVGLVLAPGGVAVLLTAQYWARRIAHVGPWPVGSAGAALMVVGSAWTLAIGHVAPVPVFIIGTTVMGTGFTMAFVAANISAVAGAREQEQGLASGLFIASFQIGSGVILAVVGSVFGTHAEATTSDYRAAILTATIVATLSLVVFLLGLVRRSAGLARPEAAPVRGDIAA